ncbi:MAG: peptidyl-prolyl cis-trans isomerase [Halothiobacillaceae bacterium]|nr:MAG: peptidyl-prolyl cis-trans isomerase [Halothiobacillaceae bacterium]
MLRALLLALAATFALPAWAGPKVVLETSQGEVTLELDADKAPRTVENFLTYVRDGHYNGTLFHRVIPDFMVQGGGFTPDFVQKPTRPAIQNEANNGLKNARGTLAMARTGDPHSATAQFFINTVDNGFLDHQAPTPRGWGYAVFGKVINGMDVVDRIQRLPTGSGGPFRTDVPREAVLIKQARLLP